MKRVLLMLCFAGAAFLQTKAQDSTKEKLKALVDGRHYIFEPTNTTTGGGRLRQLDPGYSFEINGDTLKCNLPYFGKSYNAPVDPTNIGFNFTTTDFSYDVSEGKKNSYEVAIKAKDKTYNTSFFLTVYDDGTAYLQASGTDKQAVSYKGDVKEKK